MKFVLYLAFILPIFSVYANDMRDGVKFKIYLSGKSCNEAKILKIFKNHPHVSYAKADFEFMEEKEIKLITKEGEVLKQSEINKIASSAGCSVDFVKSPIYTRLEVDLSGERCKQEAAIKAFKANQKIAYVKADFSFIGNEKEIEFVLKEERQLLHEEINKIASSASCEVDFIKRKTN